jgi:hypothetical protein
MSAATLTEAPEKRITPRQRGAVMGRFQDLDLAHRAWREYRLAIASVLTDHPGLGSINDLTSREAGYLLRVLQDCRDCRDLVAFVAHTAAEEAA